jgi:hypothetical protein
MTGKDLLDGRLTRNTTDGMTRELREFLAMMTHLDFTAIFSSYRSNDQGDKHKVVKAEHSGQYVCICR